MLTSVHNLQKLEIKDSLSLKSTASIAMKLIILLIICIVKRGEIFADA